MQAYLSFDKIFEETKFQLGRGADGSGWGENRGLGGEIAPPPVYHSALHPRTEKESFVNKIIIFQESVGTSSCPYPPQLQMQITFNSNLNENISKIPYFF